MFSSLRKKIALHEAGGLLSYRKTYLLASTRALRWLDVTVLTGFYLIVLFLSAFTMEIAKISFASFVCPFLDMGTSPEPLKGVHEIL
jgi:hypothetical protein